MKADRKFWFPAKTYGWGWGLPSRWQGWAVFSAYLVLVILGAIFLRDQHSFVDFRIYMLVLSSVLIAVCWLKGEPPKWRWGSDRSSEN